MNQEWQYHHQRISQISVYAIQDIIHLSKPTELHNKWMNPNVNYGLQLKIGYQYCFIICDKYTTLMQDVNKRVNSVQE